MAIKYELGCCATVEYRERMEGQPTETKRHEFTRYQQIINW